MGSHNKLRYDFQSQFHIKNSNFVQSVELKYIQCIDAQIEKEILCKLAMLNSQFDFFYAWLLDTLLGGFF